MLAAAMLLATIFGCQAAQQTASSLMPLANARKIFEPNGSNDMVHHTYQELPVGMLLVWNLLHVVAAKTCHTRSSCRIVLLLHRPYVTASALVTSLLQHYNLVNATSMLNLFVSK